MHFIWAHNYDVQVHFRYMFHPDPSCSMPVWMNPSTRRLGGRCDIDAWQTLHTGARVGLVEELKPLYKAVAMGRSELGRSLLG